MTESEYYSATIDSKKTQLKALLDNMALLQSYNVYNLGELTNSIAKVQSEINDIESKLKAIREDSKHVNVINYVEDFKDKNNLYYSRTESASITGDTVGDPLKDTSGPSLNILIKLSSILSVVFSPLFLSTAFFAN